MKQEEVWQTTKFNLKLAIRNCSLETFEKYVGKTKRGMFDVGKVSEYLNMWKIEDISDQCRSPTESTSIQIVKNKHI